jgi:beta-lactamase superfamily II metal-dependent hydrolase
MPRARTTRRRRAARGPVRVHFLDVGKEEYGDSVLCELGKVRILIDGAHPGNQVGSGVHPSIPQQLSTLLETTAPARVELLVVTHAHQDHIGCLPYLVEHRLLEADWALVADPGLGWGRAADEDEQPPPADSRILNLVAALREEPLSPQADDARLAQFIADAANLESTYKQMLATLTTRGTHVVRYGRDDLKGLLRAFEAIGLAIPGPSQAQLLLCAEAIARSSDDAAQVADALLGDSDAPASEADLYRLLVQPGADLADAGARPGPAINLQSIITGFHYGNAKLLFAGDMQFADPQMGDPQLQQEVTALRAEIAHAAPYSLAKLSHHGSDNGLDSDVLAELGATPLIGICAGEQSAKHPNRAVLTLLNDNRDRLTWVRTDRNGLSTIELNGEPKLSLARGEKDDPRPNTTDEAAPPSTGAPLERSRTAVPTTRATETRLTPAQSAGDRDVQVVTRIPPGVDRVAVTIEVTRTGQGAQPRSRRIADWPAAVRIAGGRPLPALLFVTSRDGLAANVGANEATQILEALAATGAALYDELPAGVDSGQALALVREQIQQRPKLVGVVLLGGYDVVPPRRLDCLPPALRQRLGQTQDADDFIVWSDEGYGDRDDDLIPELPVSRVPDGRAAELLVAALAASPPSSLATRRGVRNVARPFAEPIFGAVPGQGALDISQPTTFETTATLGGDLVYLMLHGDYIDSSRFWGENTANASEAVNLSNIPDPGGRVVFTGCCWGALAADQPALRALPGVVVSPKVAESSIALTFLRRGAVAFVGCTGAHYSPTEEPYNYFGGPMHQAFWRSIATGAAPAQALFDAKVEYVRGFPHGRTSAVQEAIEYKILRQYTCLGLGW